MTETRKIIIAFVVIAVLMIAVGYAAISNITLYINGSAAAAPNDANFLVSFSGEPTTDKTGVKLANLATATAGITDETHATLTVAGLTAKGDTVTATYTIQNTSADLSANLSASVTNTNTEYFEVTQKIEPTNVAKGATANVTVTVKLIKTPIQDEVDGNLTSTVGLTITAEPVQPTATPTPAQ